MSWATKSTYNNLEEMSMTVSNVESVTVQTLRETAIRNARRVEELKRAITLVWCRSRADSGSVQMFDIDDMLKELGVEAWHSEGPKFTR